MNSWRHTYGWVMSHIQRSHVICMLTCEWVMSRDTHEWFMSRILTSHVAHMDESCHMLIYAREMSRLGTWDCTLWNSHIVWQTRRSLALRSHGIVSGVQACTSIWCVCDWFPLNIFHTVHANHTNHIHQHICMYPNLICIDLFIHTHSDRCPPSLAPHFHTHMRSLSVSCSRSLCSRSHSPWCACHRSCVFSLVWQVWHQLQSNHKAL